MTTQPEPSSDAETTEATKTNSAEGRISTQLLRLRHRAFLRAPWLFPDPYYAESLGYHLAQDARLNLATEPPANENIQLHCVWANEYYTPSSIDGLLQGLTRLGWDRDDLFFSHSDTTAWTKRLRLSEYGGAWISLGPIKRPDDQRFFTSRRTAPLPDWADYAFGQLTSLTPSITCVSIAFVFKEDQRSVFERALRKSYNTELRRQRTGYEIFDPRALKREAIQNYRATVRADMLNWYRTHLPGVFSTQHKATGFPTCELFTLKATPLPLPEDVKASDHKYLGALGVDGRIDCWTSQKVDGLSFFWPIDRDQKVGNHGAMVATAEALSSLQRKGHEDASAEQFPHLVNDYTEHLLRLWGLLPLLNGYHEALSSMRDTPSLNSRSKSVKTLKAMAGFAQQTRDVLPVTTELLEDTEPLPTWARNTTPFVAVNPRFNGKEQLAHAIAARVRRKADRLQRLEKSVQTTIMQTSALLSAYENLRIQANIKWLTIITLILSIATAFIALENSQTVREWWK
jgi:hypothetical protein